MCSCGSTVLVQGHGICEECDQGRVVVAVTNVGEVLDSILFILSLAFWFPANRPVLARACDYITDSLHIVIFSVMRVKSNIDAYTCSS